MALPGSASSIDPLLRRLQLAARRDQSGPNERAIKLGNEGCVKGLRCMPFFSVPEAGRGKIGSGDGQ